MSFDSKFTIGPFDSRSLTEWEKQIGVPAKTLLHHGRTGEPQVFVRRPLAAAEWALIRNENSSASGECIWFSKHEIVGFVPDSELLSELLELPFVEVSEFTRVISQNLGWDPERGLVMATGRRAFDTPGWCICPFGLGDVETASGLAELQRRLKLGKATPELHRLALKVKLSHLSITQTDMVSFSTSLQSFSFVSHLFHGGAFTTEPPCYLSSKLVEMFEVNRLYWRNADDLSTAEVERRRAASLENLNGEFRALCKKESSPSGLVNFALAACDPNLDPGAKRIGMTATADLLALLTAAKLFWSSPHIRFNDPKTLPSREQVVAFLRFMGLKGKNAASAGATIIRPEIA